MGQGRCWDTPGLPMPITSYEGNVRLDCLCEEGRHTRNTEIVACHTWQPWINCLHFDPPKKRVFDISGPVLRYCVSSVHSSLLAGAELEHESKSWKRLAELTLGDCVSELWSDMNEIIMQLRTNDDSSKSSSFSRHIPAYPQSYSSLTISRTALIHSSSHPATQK